MQGLEQESARAGGDDRRPGAGCVRDGVAGGELASDARSWLWLGAPVAAGALLRFSGLARQVLGGDEMHAVQLALERPLVEILTTYSGESDHSVPLTALLRLAITAGLQPSEALLRAPVLCAGLALIPALALLVRRELGARVATVFAWLLALSPLLVLYGRILRSYGPMLGLALVAVFAFYRWLERGRKGDAVLYALTAPLAVYFHLVCAAFVGAPIVYALASRRWRRTGPGLRALGILTLLTAGVAALLFYPLRSTLVRFVEEKSGEGFWQWSTAGNALRLHSGVFSPSLSLLFFALCALGAVRLARHRPALLAYLLFVAAAHVGALFVASPSMYSHVVAFSRYTLPCLPIELVFVACASGFGRAPSASRTAWVGPAVIGGLAALFFLGGPLVTWKFRHGSFTHHNRFVAFVQDGFELTRSAANSSGVYLGLAEDESAEAILEFPADWRWHLCNAPYYAQELHRKEVLVSLGLEAYADPRLAWRNACIPDPTAYLESRADYVVVHIGRSALETRDPSEPDRENREKFWRAMEEQGAAMARELRARFGAPTLTDDRTLAWDLRIARARD